MSQRTSRLLLASLGCLALACGSKAKPAPVSTAVPITIQSTVMNVFGPSGPAPATTANLTGTGLCSTSLNLEVRVFNAISLLLSPATATPLGSCPVSPADGTFSCSNIDISQDLAALYAVVDDADNATSDCVTPTVQALVGCGYQDLTDASNASCGSGKALSGGVMNASDAGGVLVAPSVISNVVLANFDQQLTTAPAQLRPTTAQFGKLESTGWLLSLVEVTTGVSTPAPFAQALPFMPAECGSTNSAGTSFDCRAWVLNGQTLTSNQLTNSSGMWIGQMQQHDGSSPNTQIQDSGAGTDSAQSFGAIDCSGETPVQCFLAVPNFPFMQNAIFSTGAVVVNIVPSDSGGATAATNAACPFPTAAGATVPASLLACPTR